MSKVDEQDEAKKDKYRGSKHGDVIAPEHEEAVWDKERDSD